MFEVDEAHFQLMARSRLVRQYAQAFHQATGLALRLEPAGSALRWPAFGRRGTSFCNLLKLTPGGCPMCANAHAELQGRLRRKLSPQQVRCQAGLTDLAVPVVVGGEHVATLFGGQAFSRPSDRLKVTELNRVLARCGGKKDSQRLRRAYQAVPVLDPGQYQAAVRLLALFARELAESANQSLLAKGTREPPSVVAARQYVRAHFSEAVTMRIAAQAVHLSPSHFCRLFRRSTGLKFTEYLCRTRVEAAKRLVLNSRVRVSDAAMAAGFRDLSHFNHMFKRYSGMTPQEYRRAKLTV